MVEKVFFKAFSEGFLTTNNKEKANSFFIPIDTSVFVLEEKLRNIIPSMFNSTWLNSIYRYRDLINSIDSSYWTNSSISSFVILGSGTYRAKLKLVDENFMNNVTFLVNSADKALKFRKKQDVSLVCSANTALGSVAEKSCVCGSKEKLRVNGLFFAGRLSTSHLRAEIFEFVNTHADPYISTAMLETHLSPSEYVENLEKYTFCLHVRGHQGFSPRLVESIIFGCIPVFILDEIQLVDNPYSPPLSSMINWDAFSLTLSHNNITNLYEILKNADVPKLKRALCLVRPFFIYHEKPVFGDAVWVTMLNYKLLNL